MSEDTLQAVLKRLEVAEAEASRLKADLAAAQKVRVRSRSATFGPHASPAPGKSCAQSLWRNACISTEDSSPCLPDLFQLPKVVRAACRPLTGRRRMSLFG